MQYPSVIRNLSEKLSRKLVLKHYSIRDGRQASAIQEKQVIETVERYIHNDIIIPESSRNWFDFAVYDTLSGSCIPVNIKITERKSRSNIHSSKGMVYTFSTLHHTKIPNRMSFNTMVELIDDNKQMKRDMTHEYYYLFVDKSTNDVLIKSLCDLQCLHPNGSNWLQASMQKEMKYKDVYTPDIDESYTRVRRALSKSLVKRIQKSYKLLKPEIFL